MTYSFERVASKLTNAMRARWLTGSRSHATRAPSRRAPPPFAKTPIHRAVSFEALEARLLLSADSVVSGFTANFEQGLTAVGAEVQQLLQSDPVFASVVPGVLETQGSGADAVESSPTVLQTLDSPVDVDPNSNKASGGLGFFGGGSLTERFQFIDQAVPLGIGFFYNDAGADERALDAMDYLKADGTPGQDGKVTWREAFDVLVTGQISEFLNVVNPADPGALATSLTSFLNSSFGLPSYLSDRFDLSVSASNLSTDDDIKVGLDLTLSFDHEDTLYLGYESEQLGIATDPVLPGSTPAPTKVTVDAGLRFRSMVVGLVDVVADGTSAADDFVFAVRDKPSDSSDGMAVSVEIDDSGDIDNNGAARTETFEVNVGFLGADVANGKILLDMDAYGGSTDPSNPDALGFSLDQQGVANSSGTLLADVTPDFADLDASDIFFTLKVGNGPLVEPVEITLDNGSANDDADQIAGSLNTAIATTNAALGAIVSATNDSGRVRLSLVASDPSALGFANEVLGATITAANPSSLIGQMPLGSPIQLLLGVGGAIPKLVTVNVQGDPLGPDGLSGDAATDADNGQVSLASLKTSLDTALDTAFGNGTLTVGDDGSNKLTITGPGTLEITRTLTLDTVDEITLAELGSGQVLSAAKDPNSKFELDLDVTTETGLAKPDDTPFNASGTIKFTITDPFDPAKVGKVVVDVNPTTGEEVLRADFDLKDESGDLLRDGTSDMQPLLDFNVLTTAEVLGLINQVGTWMSRLSASELLNEYDIPFADLALGELLDFKDLIGDTLLIDDLDDGIKAGTNDVDRLLKWVQINGQNQLAPRFLTAQELGDRLAEVLNDLDDAFGTNLFADDAAARAFIDPTYDPATRELTYKLQLDHVLAARQVDLDFDMDLGPLGKYDPDDDAQVGISVDGAVKLSATGHFGFTMGIKMGTAVAALTDASNLSEFNSGAGVAINDHLALTTVDLIKPLVGRLTSDADFTLTVARSTDGPSGPTVTPLTLTKTATDDNVQISDLVSDLNTVLAGTGITADHDGDRVVLKATGANITKFQITSSSGDPAFAELGLQPEAAATTSLILPVAVNQALDVGGGVLMNGLKPGQDIKLDLVLYRPGPSATVAVNVGTSLTNQNLTINDLVADINTALQNALAATLGEAAKFDVVASHVLGFIVFSAVAADIDAITVAPTAGNTADQNNALKAIGLDLDAAKQRLKDLGVDTAAADAITKLTAGIALRGPGVPTDNLASGSTFGRLTANADFTINGVAVHIEKTDAATNSSVTDLVRDLNAALNTTTLKGRIVAEVDGGHIQLYTIDPTITTLTLDGLDAKEPQELGLANNTPGGLGRTLALTANKPAPVSFGVVSDSTFKLTVVGGDNAVTDMEVKIQRDATTDNRSLYDLAGTINSAINAAYAKWNTDHGTTKKNPLVATVQAGKIVLGLKIGDGNGAQLFDLNPPIANGLATVAAGITAFSITPNDAESANRLKLSTAIGTANSTSTALVGTTLTQGTADFIIYTRDGSSYGISLDELRDPNLDNAPKLIGTVAELKAKIAAQTNNKVELQIADDGVSLKLIDKSLPGDTNFADDPGVLRVVVVNGSPAAVHLGLFGSDTSALNSGSYTFNPGTYGNPDGIIEGARVATVDPLDRFFIRNPVLSSDVTLSTVDLDNDATTPDATAEANFGFVGVKLETTSQNQQLLAATAAVPFADTDMTLGELFGGLNSTGDLRNFVGLPTLTTSSDFDLKVSIFPDLSSLITLPAGSLLHFDIQNLGSLVDDGLGGAVKLTLPSIDVSGINIGDLANFEAIEFDSIIQALKNISAFLSQFSAFDFLNEEIPVVGLSVNDLLEVADKFAQAVQDIEENPAGGLQLLDQKIREAFGLPSFADNAQRDAFFANLGIPNPTDLIAFALKEFDAGVPGKDFLRFDLRLPVGFSEGISIDLDLGEALGVDLGPVDIQGGAGLNVKGFLDARLSFGIDLNDPTQIWLFDDASAIFGGLSAGATNLAFNAAIGPMGVFIRDGNIQIDVDFGLDNGSFNAGSDNKVAIDDPAAAIAAFGNFDPSLTGTVQATLPVHFPTESEFLGDIKLDMSGANAIVLDGSNGLQLPNLADVLTLPDFSGIDLSSLNPFDSIPLMLDALDFLLLGLQDIVDGEVFGFELPLIGDQLASAAGFIEDLRQDVLAPIRQYVEQAPELGQELIQKLLYSLLGPGSAGVTFGGGDLHEFLGLTNPISGLNLLADYATGTGAVTTDDIVASAVGDEEFLWKFRLKQTFSPPVDINFDLGFDALGLAMDGGLDVDISWDLALGLGVSKEDGAYIFIGDHREAGTSDDAELLLTLDVALQEGTNLDGRLAFLQLLIDESSFDDSQLEQDDTHFHAQFGVDLKEKNATNADDAAKLTFSELGSLDADVALSADAEVNLQVTAQFNEAILPDAVTALLPKVTTRFALDWETGDIFAEDFDFGTSLKFLGFRDVNIDMGSFLSDFLGPVVDKIYEVTEPLQPIIDVITAPIPVISQLAGEPVTLVDIAGLTGYVEPAMIYAIADIIELVNKIGEVAGAGELLIPLGDFVLIQQNSPYEVGSADLANNLGLPTFDLSDPDVFDLGNALSASGAVADIITTAGDFLDALSNAPAGDTKNLSQGLLGGTEPSSSGFKFPLFDDPSQIFGLLLGREVDLITYDLAPFGMDFSYTQKFPIWDGLFARITGSAGLTIDLAFGYDTHGVREFAGGGFENPLDLLAGFYVSDTNLGPADVPELILRGELAAGAELNLGIASAGAEGGIILTVNFDLYDPDRDGKVRVDELLGSFLYEFNYGNPLLAPVAIFDVYGDVAAQLRLFVESVFFEFTFNITPPITLFEFSIPFDREPFLATERGDGTVLLNIGPNAAQRLNGDTRDISEKIYVRSLDENTIEVWAPELGVPESAAQKYDLGDKRIIVGFGGEGNDLIDLSQVTHAGIAYELEGGVGDDELHGGQNGGKMKGDEGNDKLFGGDGRDLIIGGEGSDTIEGGGERDYIFGDTGTFNVKEPETATPDNPLDDIPVRIRSLVGEKDGADTIKGDGGDDIIFGGGSIDVIQGNDGADLIFGDGGYFDFTPDGDVPFAGGVVDISKLNARGSGAKDLIQGNAGDDTILAGAGDDFADGGADDDLILGDVGFDTLYGGSGADRVYGGDHDDVIFGMRDPFVPAEFAGYEDAADAAADGQDYVEGGEGNDFIRGQDDNDTLHGNRGADIIFGDAGNDIIGAGILVKPWITDPTKQVSDNEAGGDIIFGGADDDTIDAGDSGDFVFGDDGLVIYLDFESTAGLLPAVQLGSRIRTDATAKHKLIGDGDETVLIAGYTADDDADTLSMDLLTAQPVATDGSDRIIGGDGKDIIFGGGSNEAGATDPAQVDTIFGDFDPAAPPTGPRPSGQDLIIGDGGRVELFGRRYAAAKAISNAEDGRDVISGNDSSDYIFGGGFQDTIYGFEDPATFNNALLEGVIDNDVIFGDNGEIHYDPTETANRITWMFTTAVAGDSGRSDVILGNEGNDVAFGGLNGSNDVINGNLGDDVLVGDQGAIYFKDDPATPEVEGDSDLDTIDLIRSFTDGLGGDDIISGDQGNDVMAGGTGADLMYGDNATASNGAADGEDIMLGDNGDVRLIGPTGRLLVQVAAMPAGTAVDLITTTDVVETTGGADTMSGNAKADIMVGGVNNGGQDVMYGDRAVPNATTIGNDGEDIMLGDNGLLDFTFEADTDRNTLDLIRSFEDDGGGVDVISGNKGLDVAIGGTDGDIIFGDDLAASAGASDLGDLLLGDNADIFLVARGAAAGGDLKVVLDAAVKTIRTTDEENPQFGGSDTISGNANGDIIAGGVQGDLLYGDALTVVPALDGDDIILGDNGAFEWLSNGRLNEIVGIDIAANNPALFAKYGDPLVFDTDLTTLDLITTEQPTNGGRDTIYGDERNDLVFGGTDLDVIHGDDGDEAAEIAAANRDVLFGDHGRLYPQFSALTSFHARNFFAIDIGDGHGGEGDLMWGEEGDDVMLGQQGDDRMWGGSHDDDMIGGHNVSGGYDELTAPAVVAVLNPPVNDLMDGGSGDDAMAGDNAIVWRRGDDLSPRFRLLAAGKTAIYTTSVDGVDPAIVTNVGAASQSDPDDAVGRDIELVDHSDDVQSTPNGRFGADVMAGGADSDVMYGELGDDLMQGDGNIATADDGLDQFITRTLTVTDSGANPDTDQTLYFNIPEQGTDADDYMEGNGGSDLMYGGLGQDDMIGGSSELFGLVTEAMRPDGSDIIYGGAGAPARLVRNDFVGDSDTDVGTALGGATPTGDDPSIALVDRHSRDADFIMGDNANVFRLVSASDLFLEFNYDKTISGVVERGEERIVVRAMEQVDYTLGGADFHGGVYVATGAAQLDGQPADNGAGDLIHGESGDDYIFGMTGSDVIFGESDDDDIVGGYGNDWISGGTGQDGVLGDDGLMLTSRNSTLGEPLYGIAGLLASDPASKYANGNVLDEVISTPGQIQYAVINKSNELKKSANLVPFSYDSSWIGTDDEFPDDFTNTPFADDIIFGGLGSDFLHGGSGDDAISGAEALEHAFVPIGFDVDGNPTGILDLGYNAFDLADPVNAGDTVANPNPGDVLAFNPEDLDGQHLNNRFRAGEFFLYNEYEPRMKILLTALGELSTDGTGAEFLLNFDKTEGVFRASGTVPKATGQQTETYPAVNDDGGDAIFGDLGNDWIVGGTGADDMYGGWGNDYLQADDDLVTETAGVAAPFDNESPDTHPFYQDRAYGGAGRDVLIANTGGDRLIDWVGEYNSYLVPFAPFGEATVSRTLQPFLPEFLYALSAGDGADPTRYADAIGGTPPAPTTNNPNPSRNGEPHGELGLVLQKDFAWQDQTGAPADPQAGNIPGGPRDVLRSAGFNDSTAQGFFVDSGIWSATNGKYQVAPVSLGGDGVSVFYVDSYIPSYFEMLATLSAVKPTGGYSANAYLLFDYQSPTDFKFAGINVSTNKLEIGHRNEQGWFVDRQGSYPSQIRSDTDYNVFLALNGTNVILTVNNQVTMTYTFAPRIDAFGIAHGLNEGMVGLGAKNSKAQVDNVAVQRVRPVTTFTQTVDFGDGTTGLFEAPQEGTWAIAGGRYAGTAGGTPAIVAMSPDVVGSALVDLSGTFAVTGEGGFVYDQYSETEFKFVSVSAGKVTLGHRTAKGWFTDATYSSPSLQTGIDYTLGLTLKGTTVSVTLNGAMILSRAYNALVTDGGLGLFSRTGTTSYDSVTFRTDDPSMLNQSFALTAAESDASSGVFTLSEEDVARTAAIAIQNWGAVLGSEAIETLQSIQFELVNDLPGSALAWSVDGGTILIDMTAAGHGWFVDGTPARDEEFFAAPGSVLIAKPGTVAYGRMDLLSAVQHEMGHALGLMHDDADGVSATMNETLLPGTRVRLESAVADTSDPTAPGFSAARALVDDVELHRAPSLDAVAPRIDWNGTLDEDLEKKRNGRDVSEARPGGKPLWVRDFISRAGSSDGQANPNAGLKITIGAGSKAAPRVTSI